MLSVSRHREDYRTAIGWAAAQPMLDESRIVVWGTSFAGRHVVDLAVTDRRIAGAIAPAPLVDAVAAARLVPAGQSLRLLGLAARDVVGGLLGRRGTSRAQAIPAASRSARHRTPVSANA
ncbi:hypothetical protein QRX50_19160 [Amycolatopsis carbonis]|uniref:Peptidase S9 prolyl oligopeptidase catalytic domain-containing protein n=1 Tax=Amycolatopsis carbonis TaxID=715471 RepID=A0A9Y2N2G2_9PSEU|nr:hypothetical protein [Amycolatopsis sp. 2-15]WIX83964.1 hypothetical protein QRX50_19160 [Amycolatopsis sp. 2-15]